MTQIITFASAKGGVGKTSLAFAIASELYGRGQCVAAIDMDPNGTLHGIFSIGKLPDIESCRATVENMRELLEEVSKTKDFVLFDLEGTDNQAMIFAIGLASLVLVPARPSAFDVMEAVKTVNSLRNAEGLMRLKIPYRVILTCTNHFRMQVMDHSRAEFAREGLPLMEAEFVTRTAFQKMTFSGISPVQSDPLSPAAENIAAIVDELIKNKLVALRPPAYKDLKASDG